MRLSAAIRPAPSASAARKLHCRARASDGHRPLPLIRAQLRLLVSEIEKMSQGRKQVVVMQYRLLHYRLGLFELLRQRCAEANVDLCLVHGQPTETERKKRDTGQLPWADQVRNRYVSIRGRDILWQPFPRKYRHADLVVVMQENRLLSNYPLLLSRLWRARKVAYWGHGVNFQSVAPTGLRERWKQLWLTAVDWWFAYTDVTRAIVARSGFPAERTTVLDNAIDNQHFLVDLDSVPAAELDGLREGLSIPAAAKIGLFCGSLYIDKRLPFMIEAADRIKYEVPDFHLVVVGDGPLAHLVRDAAASRPWLHVVGVKMGRDKAAYFRLADVVFNPGAVGLHVLDAFCAGVPMATTADARHGPEIVYLEHGVNGLVTAGEVPVYAQAVSELLRDPLRHEAICRAAAEAAQRYTLNNMVERFVDGIVRCLELPR